MAEISAIFCFFYCRFNLKFVIFSGDFLLIFVCTKPHPARGEFFTVNLFLSPRILPAATGGNSQGFLFSGGWGGIMLLHSPIHYGPPRWKMFWGIVGLFCIQKNFELPSSTKMVPLPFPRKKKPQNRSCYFVSPTQIPSQVEKLFKELPRIFLPHGIDENLL